MPWFKIGFMVSIYHMIVWLGVGSIWWKIIGWW
jgi:DASS family divalent anion:Na+ symporter